MTELIATGPRLKAERERRGLSPQKAADELHLDGWVIDALESENYARIGPSVYAKGHLRRYATLLGLPADEIMAGYESREQTPNPPALQAANMRLRTDEQAVTNFPWQRVAAAAAVLVLVLGTLWWKPWHRHGAAVVGENTAASPSTASPGGAADAATGTGGSAAPPATTPAAPATPGLMLTTMTPSSGAAAPSAAGAGTATGSGAAAASPPPEGDTTAGVGRARLRLSFSADSWVDVHDAAGRRVFAGNGRANSVKTIAGVAPMRVYLGFASGVQLEINDRAVAIGPQFVAGDVARFEAGADGILRRDARSAAAPSAPARAARPSN